VFRARLVVKGECYPVLPWLDIAGIPRESNTAQRENWKMEISDLHPVSGRSKRGYSGEDGKWALARAAVSNVGRRHQRLQDLGDFPALA